MEAFLSMQQQMPGQVLQMLNLPDCLCWPCICLIKKSSPTPMMLLSSKCYWTSKYKWSVEKKSSQYLKMPEEKINPFHELEEREGFVPYSLKLQQGFQSMYLERENNNTWLPLISSSLWGHKRNKKQWPKESKEMYYQRCHPMVWLTERSLPVQA